MGIFARNLTVHDPVLSGLTTVLPSDVLGAVRMLGAFGGSNPEVDKGGMLVQDILSFEVNPLRERAAIPVLRGKPTHDTLTSLGLVFPPEAVTSVFQEDVGSYPLRGGKLIPNTLKGVPSNYGEAFLSPDNTPIGIMIEGGRSNTRPLDSLSTITKDVREMSSTQQWEMLDSFIERHNLKVFGSTEEIAKELSQAQRLPSVGGFKGASELDGPAARAYKKFVLSEEGLQDYGRKLLENNVPKEELLAIKTKLQRFSKSLQADLSLIQRSEMGLGGDTLESLLDRNARRVSIFEKKLIGDVLDTRISVLDDAIKGNLDRFAARGLKEFGGIDNVKNLTDAELRELSFRTSVGYEEELARLEKRKPTIRVGEQVEMSSTSHRQGKFSIEEVLGGNKVRLKSLVSGEEEEVPIAVLDHVKFITQPDSLTRNQWVDLKREESEARQKLIKEEAERLRVQQAKDAKEAGERLTKTRQAAEKATEAKTESSKPSVPDPIAETKKVVTERAERAERKQASGAKPPSKPPDKGTPVSPASDTDPPPKPEPPGKKTADAFEQANAKATTETGTPATPKASTTEPKPQPTGKPQIPKTESSSPIGPTAAKTVAPEEIAEEAAAGASKIEKVFGAKAVRETKDLLHGKAGVALGAALAVIAGSSLYHSIVDDNKGRRDPRHPTPSEAQASSLAMMATAGSTGIFALSGKTISSAFKRNVFFGTLIGATAMASNNRGERPGHTMALTMGTLAVGVGAFLLGRKMVPKILQAATEGVREMFHGGEEFVQKMTDTVQKAVTAHPQLSSLINQDTGGFLAALTSVPVAHRLIQRSVVWNRYNKNAAQTDLTLYPNLMATMAGDKYPREFTGMTPIPSNKSAKLTFRGEVRTHYNPGSVKRETRI